ncbi:hypothetical protein [Zongyangia hominis]|uniref:Uncharacterized protein n=1 Tax=Zongyangia hominis TaxID=2763677 RepID=A0A926E9G1_9FIRM|nr:hypothetical protein [Zongyangia hominis]MBC8569653.1 hypothetical protein [Zongyangia hominis]
MLYALIFKAKLKKHGKIPMLFALGQAGMFIHGQKKNTRKEWAKRVQVK